MPIKLTQSYERRYPIEGNLVAETSIPWNIRSATSPTDQSHMFSFLARPFFWSKVDFAARVTLLCCLPTAVLVNDSTSSTFFVSRTLIISGALICVRGTLGEAVLFSISWLKAAIIVIGLGTWGTAMNLDQDPYQWATFYGAFTLLMGFFLSDNVRRMAILMFTNSMVGQFNPKFQNDLLFTSRVLWEFGIGVGIGLVATCLPYQLRASRNADHHLTLIAKNLAICFSGLCESFWCHSNPQRHINLVRCRFAKRSITQLNAELSHYLEISRAEPEKQKTKMEREVRVEVIKELIGSIESLQRVLEQVADFPHLLQTDRAIKFKNYMTMGILDLAAVVDRCLYEFGEKRPMPVENLVVSLKAMDDIYNRARREIVYESDETYHYEEFHNFMMFFHFTILHFGQVLLSVEGRLKDPSKGGKPFWRTTCWEPVLDIGYQMIRYARRKSTEEDIRLIKEAFKTSLALLLSVAFLRFWMPVVPSRQGPRSLRLCRRINPVRLCKGA
eukprot:PhF_6_TR37483/c0_g1_i5/m.55262